MPEFLLETYASRTNPDAVDAGAERARQAAEKLSAEGTAVLFLRMMFLPEEETCFYLYQAASADDVREAAKRAGLPTDNIVEAISDQKVAR
jgi:hypothetical protein